MLRCGLPKGLMRSPYARMKYQRRQASRGGWISRIGSWRQVEHGCDVGRPPFVVRQPCGGEQNPFRSAGMDVRDRTTGPQIADHRQASPHDDDPVARPDIRTLATPSSEQLHVPFLPSLELHRATGNVILQKVEIHAIGRPFTRPHASVPCPEGTATFMHRASPAVEDRE